MELMRLHHGPRPQTRHLPGLTRLNPVTGLLKKDRSLILLLLLWLLLLLLVVLTWANTSWMHSLHCKFLANKTLLGK